MVETLSQPKQTKARKEHICDFCNGKIRVSETYEKATFAYDGQVYEWKTHNHCSKLARRLNMYDNRDEGVTTDYFMEAVSEEHNNILVRKIPNELRNELNDFIRQLKYVSFQQKLWFVIRHYNKLDEKTIDSDCDYVSGLRAVATNTAQGNKSMNMSTNKSNGSEIRTHSAFENLEEKKEAYLIVSDIFDTISNDLKVKDIEKYNSKAFNLIEQTSKKIAKSFIDRLIKSHQDWATEQDEYFDFYEKVKIEIDGL